jgi:hypothetical protein
MKFILPVLLLVLLPALAAAQRPLGPPVAVNVQTAGLQSAGAVAVAMNARGDFTVAWENVPTVGGGEFRPLYVRRFAADGTPATGEILVTGGSQDRPSAQIALMDDGSFFVVLPLYPDLVARRYGADGSFHGETVVGPGILRDSFSVAARPAGGFDLVWTLHPGDQGVLVAQIVGADGEPVGPGRRLGTGSSPAVTAEPDGGLLAAWIAAQPVPGDTHLEDLYVLAQRFGSDGEPVGERIAVQDRFHGVAGSLRAAADGAGNDLLVWHEEGQLRPARGHGETRIGIYARRFAPDGSPLTGVLELEERGTSQPQLAIDGDGDFVTTFLDSESILAQRFTADGTPIRPALRLAPSSGGALVASDAGGNFVLVRSPSPLRIVAQRYRKR